MADTTHTHDIPDDLRRRTIHELSAAMRTDSRKWFPDLHGSSWDLIVAYTLGLAGETGEVANIIKKLNRGKLGRTKTSDNKASDTLGEELADVLTYLLLLAAELNIDLEAEWERKRAKNNQRWST